ncbi:hypothetical protein LPMP_312030 [Leishmania panamensis]|uniref:Uncharacterized protein n=1 Tax=Leishmania panamensis TaxID=5679 RepID=A0A088RXY1_LEIPA|nr:hypothetical protein LPMP_312030 [Leishmania panamensis]AIO00791.1 hypothetical protein LPMP_312030 [Leishmania panamensis]
MPARGSPQPCKRFGTFGDPHREPTQAEREFYASLARIRTKSKAEREKLPVEKKNQEDIERENNRGWTSQEKSANKLLSAGRRSLTPGAPETGNALTVPCPPPRDHRLTVLSAVGLPSRTTPPVWEPNRHEARSCTASEDTSDCKRTSERRRGFGFNEEHTPEGLYKPEDSILLPSRYRSASPSQESPPCGQRARRVLRGSLADASEAPERAPDLPLGAQLLEELPRMKVTLASQTSAQTFPKNGAVDPSSAMGGNGSGGNIDMSRVAHLSEDEMGMESRIDQALDAFHRKHSSGGSMIRGLTDEQVETLEQLLAKRRKLCSVAVAAHSSPSKPPAPHPPEARAVIEERLAAPDASPKATKINPMTKQGTTQEAAAQKKAALGSLHSTPMSTPRAVAAAGVASLAQVATLPPLARAPLNEVVPKATLVRAPSPLSATETVCAVPSPTITQSHPILHANDTERHILTTSSETRKEEHRPKPACVFNRSRGASPSRSGSGAFLCVIPCTSGVASRGGLAEKEGTRAPQNTSRTEMRTQARVASSAETVEEACRQYAEQCRRDAQELHISIEQQRQRVGAAPRKVDSISPNSITHISAVILPTPTGEVIGSWSQPFTPHPRESENALPFTASLVYERSPTVASRISARTISHMDTTSIAGRCSTSSAVSVAEETGKLIMMAYHNADSPQVNQLHINTGALDLSQCVLSDAPAHTASSGASGSSAWGDDASRTSSDLYTLSSLLEYQSAISPHQQVTGKTPTPLSSTEVLLLPFSTL